MEPLVIYHGDCTDGFGAAFAAWLKLGDSAEYAPVKYGATHPADFIDWISDREVYVIDFSFPRPVMELLFVHAAKVVWLDHHKTAFEMWCPGELIHWMSDPMDTSRHIRLDNNKSGALLAWEYFHPDTPVPMFTSLIDDRDRWQFRLEGSKEFHAALATYKPWSFDQWQTILDLQDSVAVDQMIDEGWAIIRAQTQAVGDMAKQATKCGIVFNAENGVDPADAVPTSHADGYMRRFDGLAANASLHISEVGHELANESGTYGLVWYVGQDKRVKCSLRSNGDYDVSAIAKCFGGGGHKNAAGFETDIRTLMSWL